MKPSPIPINYILSLYVVANANIFASLNNTYKHIQLKKKNKTNEVFLGQEIMSLIRQHGSKLGGQFA